MEVRRSTAEGFEGLKLKNSMAVVGLLFLVFARKIVTAGRRYNGKWRVGEGGTAG